MRFKLLIILMFLGMVYLVYGAGCCVETVSNEYGEVFYCQDPDDLGDLGCSNINEGVSCGETNACGGGGGCCDLTQEGGSCSKRVVESNCAAQGGNWDSDSLCLSVQGCADVCCGIGGVNIWTSEGDCVSNLNGNVDSLIGNQEGCTQSNQEGCCADNCKYLEKDGSGGSCSEGNLFEDIICYDVAVCKDQLTHHASQGCGNTPDTRNDVYYFDSKGNMEELIEDCNPPSTSCGDKDDDGNFKCENLDCEETWNNPLTSEDDDKRYRRNGETWCQYQSAVGPGLDLPGTSHYLHSCINGKESAKSCDPERNKICIWDDNGAACVDNEWGECMECTNSACCEDAGKLCLWLDTPHYKRCIPVVPPGNILDPGDKPDKGRGKYCGVTVKSSESDKLDYLCNMFGECGMDYNLAGDLKGAFSFDRLKDPGKGLYKLNENKDDLLDFEGASKKAETEYFSCMGLCKRGGNYKNSYVNCINQETLICAGLTGKECAPNQQYFWGCSKYISRSSICEKGIISRCKKKKEQNICDRACGISSGYVHSAYNKAKSGRVLTKNCGLWDPGYGVDSCSRCRKGDLLPNYDFAGEGYTCTQQLCESLGNCEWLGEGDAPLEGPACIAEDISDIDPPVISVDYDTFKYNCNLEEPGQIGGCSLEESDEPKGVTVKGELVDSYEGGNEKANVTIGIAVDKYSKCSYSSDLAVSFDDMDYDFSRGKLGLNHQETFIDKLGDLDLRDGKEYVIYIMCKGYNDRLSDSFFVKFKKAEQPDLSPPVIYRLTFEPETESYVLFGKETEPVLFNLNEDAECRWSNDPDLNYGDMKNDLECVGSTCAGELNVSVGENKYYFRCKDLSPNENENQADQPYDGYRLYGSESNLSIESVSCVHKLPDGSYVNECDTILAKNFTLRIKTIGGAKNGEARCSYNGNVFFKTDGKEHEQCIGCGGGQYLLQEGSYQYRISCIDVGKNEAYYVMNSFLKIDYRAPRIERYYIKNNMLNVETNEPSYCRFTNSFKINYNTATEMATSDGLTHSTSASKDYYKIQCKDRFDNKMAPVNIYLTYI